MYESYVTFEIPKQTYDVVISFKILDEIPTAQILKMNDKLDIIK